MTGAEAHFNAVDAVPDVVEYATDVCALPLVRRLAALLDRDPGALHDGDPLPRGWHVILFNVPTPQSQLRADGAAHLGFSMPSLGLPRLMLGGRRIEFIGDIPIGAAVERESRRGAVETKHGRSGRFALVSVEHRLSVGGGAPLLIETSDYIFREATLADGSPTAVALAPYPLSQAADEHRLAARTLIPDEPMLFRYSAITDNPHRIHYDRRYAMEVESYPGLVVNGSIPSMFLVEMLREVTGREPRVLDSRNLAPMFSGEPLTLTVAPEADGWRLRAVDRGGTVTFDALAG